MKHWYFSLLLNVEISTENVHNISTTFVHLNKESKLLLHLNTGLGQDCSISSAFAMEIQILDHISTIHGSVDSVGIHHDDVITWKHFPRYWPFVRGIHWWPVHSPHKGQWRGALMFSLICAWINCWVNNSKAGDLRLHQAHSDVIVMSLPIGWVCD